MSVSYAMTRGTIGGISKFFYVLAASKLKSSQMGIGELFLRRGHGLFGVRAQFSDSHGAS